MAEVEEWKSEDEINGDWGWRSRGTQTQCQRESKKNRKPTKRGGMNEMKNRRIEEECSFFLLLFFFSFLTEYLGRKS